MTKIPPKTTINHGLQVLGDVFAEIDKQVGAEQDTQDDKVSDREVATFLGERGSLSKTAGASVAAVQAYMRHVVQSSEVPVTDIRATLAKAGGYIERDRGEGLEMANMKPTWRALAMLAEVFDGIGRVYGGGPLSTEAIRAFLAGGPNTVATAKEAVRRFASYLENRTGKTDFTSDDVNAAFAQAQRAIKKNAESVDDRSQLARTWRALTAFTDDNLQRQKKASDIVGTPATTAPAPAGPHAGGPRAADVAAFLALDTDTKAEILDDYGNLHEYYIASGETRIDALAEPAKSFAQ